MNSQFAVIIAPMGCFTTSHGACAIQREAQSYVRDFHVRDQLASRKRAIRSILSVKQFTPEIDGAIRAHLRHFDLRDVWPKLSGIERAEVSKRLYQRVLDAAHGRLQGTAVFESLVILK